MKKIKHQTNSLFADHFNKMIIWRANRSRLILIIIRCIFRSEEEIPDDHILSPSSTLSVGIHLNSLIQSRWAIAVIRTSFLLLLLSLPLTQVFSLIEFLDINMTLSLWFSIPVMFISMPFAWISVDGEINIRPSLPSFLFALSSFHESTKFLIFFLLNRFFVLRCMYAYTNVCVCVWVFNKDAE